MITMPRFFVDRQPENGLLVLRGEDAHHAGRVLRLRQGEALTLCDGEGIDYDCTVEQIEKDAVLCRVRDRHPAATEPGQRLTLFMALPKGDKMEFIVQKAVELGVSCLLYTSQVDKFAHSVEGRYIQEVRGEDAIEFDPSWYQGDDIKALAHDLVGQYGDSLLDKTPEERFAIIEGYGLPTNIARMERDLGRYKINYDVWFRESELHESGYVKETIDILTEKGATYETTDGALWLRSTDFGCDKDDVLRRANGFYTYFAADIAYHRNKFEKRGFDRVINIWGADHHGHVKRLQCALDALGLDGSHRLEIVLMQLVRMMQGGEVVRMSKRTGKSLTLTDLLDEIPVDAARFFFNSRAAETQMEFDLDLSLIHI